MNNNNNNNNANNFQQQQQQQQQPMRVMGSATAGSSSESGKSEHQARSDRFSLGKITSSSYPHFVDKAMPYWQGFP